MCFGDFGFGGDNDLRETVITNVLFVFEHFFYSSAKGILYSISVSVNNNFL